MESRHIIHIEHDGGEIAALAAQQRDDALYRLLHLGRRRRFPGGGKAVEHAARVPASPASGS